MWCFLSLRLWLIFSFALSFLCGCSLLCLFQCTWILPCPVPLKTDLLTVLEAAHPYISSPPTAQNPITIRKEGKKKPSPVTFSVVTTEEWEVNCWQRPAQVLQLRSLWLTTFTFVCILLWLLPRCFWPFLKTQYLLNGPLLWFSA